MSKLSLILSFLLVAAGCATGSSYNPFQIPKDDLYAKVRTIAVVPISGWPDRQRETGQFESRIEAKLHEAGFVVVPSIEYANIWEQRIGEVGGVFDPNTGKKNEAKFESARKYTYRELGIRFNVDAVFVPEIHLVKAPWRGYVAVWHGARQTLGSSGQGPWNSGTIGALSLKAQIEDLDGDPLYLYGGGIQLLYTFDWPDTYELIPKYQILTDSLRNDAAVDFALEPLIDK